MAIRRKPALVPAVKPEEAKILQNMGEMDAVTDPGTTEVEPLYKVFKGSRIPISKAVGKSWKAKHDATILTNTYTWDAWEEIFRYYNHNQVKNNQTPRGNFKRGDATENIVFSNINTVLPATYSKNPDISCTTTDGKVEPMCKTMQALLNTLIKKRQAPGINLKPKAKKQAMMAELTNLGVIKLDFKGKDESRDQALLEMEGLLDQMAEAKSISESNALAGKLMALEAQVEMREPSGFKVTNPLPQHLLIDPYAEAEDGLDANWMMEATFLPTEFLNAAFTEVDDDSDDPKERHLIYKPTHKASFSNPSGDSENEIGPIITPIDEDENRPTSHTDDERLSYLFTYMTEVVYVWDKTTRRILLFQKNDWSWPIWVWDDYLHLSRFFPYFILQYVLSTGGTVTPGAASYYLDQQDAINDINRQVALLRRRAFDFYFYNSNNVDKPEVDKFIKAMNAKGQSKPQALGVKLDPQMKFSDVFSPVGLPDKDMMPFFDKSDLYAAIDRISATSDALRGVQFKANTTEDAVQAYTDATRLRIGARVDASEDCLGDLAYSMAEVCIQKFNKQDVAGLIGEKLAENWIENMSVEQFNADYNVNIVAGSIEKPTSIYKKKEAIEVTQVIGQFARISPVAIVVALRVLERAFSEVTVKQEEWEMLEQGVMQAIGFTQNPSQPGQPGGGQVADSGADPEAFREQMEALPPEIKAQAIQMQEQGASPQEIIEFMKNAAAQGGQSAPPPTNGAGHGPPPAQ